jgi:3-hydroxyacyl-CoA dehydrogenase/enoyl-CoA hydratase/3-hydroxybutyryl-CoA epimerase/enoyl-CoA isomerase
MIFQGKALSVRELEGGIAELNFDLEGEFVNKFDILTVGELEEAIDALEKSNNLKGLIVTSGKGVFIVGADISEFGPLFGQGVDAIKGHIAGNNKNFARLESLPFPTVVAIDGVALGGGFEICLSCDYRVISTNGQVGLPETKLGLIPGWGGTVRLPRVIGVDLAVEWIASGKEQKPEAALRAGAVDAVVAPEKLRDAALCTLQQAISGELDYQQRRTLKNSPLPMNANEAGMVFSTSRAGLAAMTKGNFPAPLAALDSMEQGASKGRDEAVAIETEQFAKVCLTEAATSMIGLFRSDQLIAKTAKTYAKKASKKIEKAAVLGAGIMGGGIAYQSSIKGVPIKMKDIMQDGIDLGLSEANKLLSKRVEKGRLTPRKMGEALNRIEPTLSYEGFDKVDLVVEAVVENPKVKHAVLAEVEKHVAGDAVLTSNTSTISIDFLAEALQRPENFCGMHFFNPVHMMPLVEVIRGEKSSDEAVARTVAYATSIGKKAIVVKDCPGFLVNRVLFPYFTGFTKLLSDGADFVKVDKVMSKWGWPMGPGYLLDVVGIDTAAHCETVMADGFPERMGKTSKNGIDIMYKNERFGQKNAKGFYDYAPDKRGRIQKVPAEDAYQLLAPHVAERCDFTAEEIIARTMIPMATEMARCLEEGIVDTAAEADMALIYGLGFPVFRGGVFRWVDSIGIKEFCVLADKYADLGPLYVPTPGMREMAAAGKNYYA